MRYVDLGTSDKKTTARRTTARTSAKKKHGRSWWKTGIGVALLGCLVFVLYSYMPPIKQALAGIFDNSTSVISYITSGGTQELKQDAGKTNVLLMGIDRRADEPFSYTGSDGQTYYSTFRSDTIIVASYNYESERVTMLSLPRDLWVEVPAFGEVQSYSTKITSIYGVGDTYEYPGGGPALLAKVVSDIIGMPIHYTARVDFSGFERAVDAVGGVEVDVQNAFTDYMYPIEGREDALPVSSRYKTITFRQGVQTMDGQTALEFARSRHAAGEEGTDFARSKRQQLVISAFRDKVLSTSTLLNPGALIKLSQALGDSFVTTLNPLEIPTALELAKQAKDQQIAQFNLDDRKDHPGGILYNPPMSQYGGAWVLVPEDGPAAIRRFVQQIFSAEGYQEASESATLDSEL